MLEKVFATQVTNNIYKKHRKDAYKLIRKTGKGYEQVINRTRNMLNLTSSQGNTN